MRSRVCLVLGLLGSACMPGAHTSDAGTAIAATAIAIGVVGMHRAATGDCWGHCGPGLACDQESGLCIDSGCDATCGPGEVCQRVSGLFMCKADPAAGLQFTALRPISPGAAPAQTLGLPRTLPPGMSWSPFGRLGIPLGPFVPRTPAPAPSALTPASQ